MFALIRNTPLDYAWGAEGAISGLLGDRGVCAAAGDGSPEAELWMGAHDKRPSRLLDPGQAGGAEDLLQWIAADPQTTLGRFAGGLREGDEARLPFLLKVIAAGTPLSLQAHPSLAAAREGFAREQAAGIPIDAPDRNYRDANHKPELLIALSETMETVAGFRAHRETLAAFTHLAAAELAPTDRAALEALRHRVAAAGDSRGLRALVAWALSGDDSAAAAAAALARAAERCSVCPGAPGWRDSSTVRLLAEHYPGDPGVIVALLLNRVTLHRGEAIFVGAGRPHAYLGGLGIEIMASSDNVLRGGLTAKHVDVAELLSVLDFTVVPQPFLAPVELGNGVLEYRPDVPDFRLSRVTRELGDVPSEVEVDGPAIVLVLAGKLLLRGAAGSSELLAGQSAFITPEEGDLLIEGAGDAVIAAPGLQRGDRLPLAP